MEIEVLLDIYVTCKEKFVDRAWLIEASEKDMT